MSEARRVIAQPRSKNVTVIPQRVRPLTQTPLFARRRRRVAAYARVSTNHEEQQTSYEAQVDYYTKYIQSKEQTDNWEFVQIYTDEGITATNTKHRDGFNAMVQDALDGKIDLIITKSVSRFARNTVDSLTTVRKLKERGVEVYFEKENIYTMDSKGELLITIMSSLAQEESRSISENTTWGQRKRFADGKLIMPFSSFLGYKRGPNGEPEIVPEEAETVRYIYRLYLAGNTPHGITKILESDGIPSPRGKMTWSTTTVVSILTNEKYKGDALLQKTFCTDFLTKKKKVNEGEVPQYYVENSHPAIVTHEMFEQVQQEMARRKSEGRNHRGTSCFAGKLVCECCGDLYGSKVWHSNDKYRKVVWRCNLKYKGAEPCLTPHVSEDEIMQRFVKAYNKLQDMREFVIEDCEAIIALLADTTDYDREILDLDTELGVVQEMLAQAISKNASVAMEQKAYIAQFEVLEARFENAKNQRIDLEHKRNARKAKHDALGRFIEQLKTGDVITEFSPELWIATVDKVIMKVNGENSFYFKNGTEITV